jgi:hypothetical protein
MTRTIYPDVTGDVVLQLVVNDAGDPELRIVDHDGNPRQPFSWVAQVRDGSGHVELWLGTLDQAAGFATTNDQHPEVYV